MRCFRHLLCLAGAGLLASTAVGLDSAEARQPRSYGATKAQRVQLRPGRPAERAEKVKEKPAQPQPVHLVVISIPKQRISAYGADGFRAQGAVSSGRTGFPTPVGVFSVIQKNRYHRSNIYSGAPMPFMQRITWSGVAMHEGVLPGYPASHGCIRLTHKFASELWGMTRMGVRVVVTPDDAEPIALTHAKLPAPNMTPAPASVTDAQQIKPSLVAMAGDSTADAGAAAAAAAARLLSPLERAKAERARIVAEAPARTKAAKEAAEVAAAKAVEANKAMTALREAEAAVNAARNKLDAAAKAVEQAKTPEDGERSKADQAAAEARLAEATELKTQALAAEQAKTQEALAAATAAWDAEKASDIAARTVRDGERAIEPISMLISRKTGRIHIRQAWRTLHEAPVTFKDPETPLGTHVYVAVDMQEGGKGMHWLAVTYPQTTSGPDAKPASQPSRSARRGERPEPAQAAPGRPRETASGALDRVELDEETRRFIADRLWAGASLIVSDYGLSNEAGKYTDFIVQPR
jgi:lipoprotein-anchoring transpeptidase ErfK/SrfK